MKPNKYMESSVSNCSRCGKDHATVAFTRLTNPTDEWIWWGFCPVLAEPILLKEIPTMKVVAPGVGHSY